MHSTCESIERVNSRSTLGKVDCRDGNSRVSKKPWWLGSAKYGSPNFRADFKAVASAGHREGCLVFVPIELVDEGHKRHAVKQAEPIGYAEHRRECPVLIVIR